MNFSTPLAEALTKPGRASLTVADEALGENRTVTLHTYRAAGFTSDGTVVFVLPGLRRDGDAYRDYWVEAADRYKLMIVAFSFPAEGFPGGEGYNQGGVLDPEGRLTQPAAWAFGLPLRLVAALREAGVMEGAKARLFGHSAGAQFVERLLCSMSPTPFEAVTAANAGWYSLPKLELPYPEGMGGIGLREGDVMRLLATPLTLLLGEEDKHTEGEALATGESAERQGANRYERGQNFFAAGQKAAKERGLDCAWKVQGVPGIGHDGRAMSRACAALWFTGGIPAASVLRAGGNGRPAP